MALRKIQTDQQKVIGSVNAIVEIPLLCLVILYNKKIQKAVDV